MKSVLFIFLTILTFLICSCIKNDKTMEQMKSYDGPMVESDSVLTIFSDSSIIRVKLYGDKQIELDNGNQEFPKGVRVDFYNERGDSSSVLTANHARFFKDKNLYQVTGNVVIRSIGEYKTMKTEELFWEPTAHKIHTEKEVSVQTGDKMLLGEGLEANEDFTYYKFKKPVGSFTVKQ